MLNLHCISKHKGSKMHFDLPREKCIDCVNGWTCCTHLTIQFPQCPWMPQCSVFSCEICGGVDASTEVASLSPCNSFWNAGGKNLSMLITGAIGKWDHEQDNCSHKLVETDKDAKFTEMMKTKMILEKKDENDQTGGFGCRQVMSKLMFTNGHSFWVCDHDRRCFCESPTMLGHVCITRREQWPGIGKCRIHPQKNWVHCHWQVHSQLVAGGQKNRWWFSKQKSPLFLLQGLSLTPTAFPFVLLCWRNKPLPLTLC